MKIFVGESPSQSADFFLSSGKKGGRLRSRQGVTLFELLVAMVLMVIVSSMLYSVLDIGIKSSDKGENSIAAIEVERSLLDLLHRQIHGARYDTKQKEMTISTDDETMKMVTGAPLIERQASLVLAIYRYDRHDRALYYTEKIDFYNPDYDEDYEPSLNEMTVLVHDVDELGFDYDEDEGLVKVSYLGLEHEFVPRCWQAKEER
jgi:prepilin-type N-terminal cleavage/methylation domain-containing protein